MALKFFEWLVGKQAGAAAAEECYREVTCDELFACAADYTLRRLAFDVCVDLIANAIGRCEFRTFRDGEEIKGREYWTWNFSPNTNQSSSVFLHKFVDRLYRNNEALIVSVRRRDGQEELLVADGWEQDTQEVRDTVFRKVRVGELELNRTFRERDVLRFRLNHQRVQDVIRALDDSWCAMAERAQQQFAWDRGQHWKVHINQIASGGQDFEADFAKMIAQQVAPFMQSSSAVLPEFDGYDYHRVDGAAASADSRDLRAMAEDIFEFTARGFLIPCVLVTGKVEATGDARQRFLSDVIDPICDQLQEEITRKRYGFDGWAAGSFLQVDSSTIAHYDLFGQAAGIEKLIGSGVYSINDILKAAGQATINEPWADEHYMTLNMTRLNAAAQPLGKGEGESE